MANVLNIDIETFSSIDLKRCGLYKYVQSPDFEILLFAYSLNGQKVQIVDLKRNEKIPDKIISALYDRNTTKHAYNAAFEWNCLNRFLEELNCPPLPIDQWRCTMAHGLYCGYPAGLSAIGDALGLPCDKKKLGIGMSLIRTFCIPCAPKSSNGYRERTLPHHEKEKWEVFKAYCIRDVEAEMRVLESLTAFAMPEGEQRLYELDQMINLKGVRVSKELVAGALDIGRETMQCLISEATALTGVKNPKSVQQLTKWLQEETDEEISDLKKSTVISLIESVDSQKAKRVLEIRQELGKTSVTKYAAMDNAVCQDGRIRGLLQYYGANRTGRWAGKLVQVQNLPRNYLQSLRYARELTQQKRLSHLKAIYGNVPDTLSQLIRTAFIPKEGCVFVVADFSAIEARVISWLAKEQWRMEVFATHGKIYEASASQMFNVPIEKIKKGNIEYELRQKGKVAELALGYQGAASALIQMGALDKGLSEEELPEIVRRWRETNRRIVDLWRKLESAALEAVRTMGQAAAQGIIFSFEHSYITAQTFLTVLLPSGRKLYYANPKIALNDFGRDSVHYSGMDQKTKRWGQSQTYGGKLTENIVQAIARDCLAFSLLNLQAAGYEIVMHIHDEVVIEAPKDSADLEAVCSIMATPIPWAKGLLLKADGFVCDYYKKE